MVFCIASNPEAFPSQIPRGTNWLDNLGDIGSILKVAKGLTFNTPMGYARGLVQPLYDPYGGAGRTATQALLNAIENNNIAKSSKSSLKSKSTNRQ